MNIEQLIDSILRLMDDNGLSRDRLSKYKNKAFKKIIKFCTENKIKSYSDLVFNKYNLYIDLEYSNRLFNFKDYQLFKYSIKIMNEMYNTNTIKFLQNRSMQKSLIALKKQAITNNTNSKDNIYTLIYNAELQLKKFNLKESSYKIYINHGFNIILQNHIDSGLSSFNHKLVDKLVDNEYLNYKNKKLSLRNYLILRRSAFILEKIYNNEELIWEKYPVVKKKLSDNFELILSNFNIYLKNKGNLNKLTIKKIMIEIRLWIIELNDNNLEIISNLNSKIINLCLNRRLKMHPKSQYNLIHSIKIFLTYLYSEKITKTDLSLTLPQFSAPRTSILEGFSGSVIEMLFNTVDRSTSLGKRNYAIIRIASETGLRSSDIANLKFEDIDWYNKVIHIVQIKTQKAISIPLPILSGNAIADYILHGRPKCDLPFIFLCEKPIRRVTTACLYNFLKIYIDKIDCKNLLPKKWGFHSFRRTFGKKLLELETPIDLISELLGHSKINSLKPYIAIEENGLKQCALNLVNPKKQGEN